jgi:hypothetical protein
VVYPLMDALGLPAYPLEPSGALCEQLIGRKREAERQYRESPQYESFDSWGPQWLDDLFARWASPADANSALTDAAVIAKKQLGGCTLPSGLHAGLGRVEPALPRAHRRLYWKTPDRGLR